MTKRMASTSVFSTSRMESPTNVVVSNAIWYSSPGGNRLESLHQFGPDGLVHVERVGGGQLADANADGVVAVVSEGRSCSPRRPVRRAQRRSAAPGRRCCRA